MRHIIKIEDVKAQLAAPIEVHIASSFGRDIKKTLHAIMSEGERTFYRVTDFESEFRFGNLEEAVEHYNWDLGND